MRKVTSIAFAFFGLLCINANAVTFPSVHMDTSVLDVNRTRVLLDSAQQLVGRNNAEGIEYATVALSQSIKLGNTSLEGESCLVLGRLSLFVGLFSASLEYTNKAIEIFVELEDQDNYLHAIKQIGDLYFNLSEHELALKYYDDCIESAEALNDSNHLLNALIGKGAAFGNIDKLDSALLIFNQTYKIANELGNEELAAQSFINIGDVHSWSGRPYVALEKYHELEGNFDGDFIGTRTRAGLYNSIARAYILTENVYEAKKYLTIAKQQLKKHYRLSDMKNYLEYQFMIDTLAGDYMSAVDNYQAFRNLEDSLVDTKFQQQLASFETLYNYELQERKIEELILDNEVKDLKIQERSIILYSVAVLLILLLLLVLQFIRWSRKDKRQFKQLQEQKYDLEAASEEIRAQSEDLYHKNLKLELLIKELKMTQQQVVQNEKMASLGILTAGVAHEINNPLNFISGGVNLLMQMEEELRNDQITPEYIQHFSEVNSIIVNGLDRVVKIVGALNAFSRKESGKKSNVLITDVLENTLLFLNSKLKYDIIVNKDFKLEDEVEVYHEKIHQVFLNIIDNAIFAVNQLKEGEKKISISTSKEAKTYRIVISNNGPHIPEQTVHSIFDPFYTTKNPGEGTGLGLSICFTIIQEHNGIILAENTEEGVRFVIELPTVVEDKKN